MKIQFSTQDQPSFVKHITATFTTIQHVNLPSDTSLVPSHVAAYVSKRMIDDKRALVHRCTRMMFECFIFAPFNCIVFLGVGGCTNALFSHLITASFFLVWEDVRMHYCHVVSSLSEYPCLTENLRLRGHIFIFLLLI